MNKFVTSALALAVVGSLAYAGTGDNEWPELDREITNLSSSLANSQDGGMGWSALLRITGTYSDDAIATGDDGIPPDEDDIFGFSFEDVDLAFYGSVGDYSWRISMDVDGKGGDGNDFVLEDGYVSWDCGGYFTASMGRHKANTLMSAATNPEHLLFINRSALGAAFDSWDEGIAAAGAYEEMFSWSLSVQNGDNGQAADHRYTFRVEYEIGEGSGEAEGALGAGPDLAATIGLTYLDDDSQDPGGGLGDNDAWGIDVRGTAGPIGFGAEIMDIGDDLSLGTDEDYFRTGSSGTSLGFDDDGGGVNVGGAT
ncbi:MAG: hypothetical protein O7B99_02160, partial [Planctomycetota bacterium]|nr:hypothetical protein [Planctomycetota bacterium]